MELAAFFDLGFIVGMISTFVYILYLGNKELKKQEEELETQTKEVQAKLSVNDRLKQVRAITEEQLDLLQQADHPQKNGLDGKFKNGLNGKVKELEKEKEEILKSIVTDGHDPLITTTDADGVVTQMKLSSYLANNGIVAVAPKQPEPPKPRQAGKFTIYKGGKPDDTTH